MHMTTAASGEASRLRAVAQIVGGSTREDDTHLRQRRRKVEESLDVLYVDDNVENKTQQKEDEEETTVHETDESANEDKASSTTAHTEDTLSMSKQETNGAKHAIPSATFAERETEDPLLAQEDSTTLMFLNLSLSLMVQRFLAFMAAVLGMVLTAHQMSENPDGFYASLCRSILTVIRTMCRIVTCKPCGFGDGRGASAHRHIPISTMEYGYKVTDPSVEFQ